MFLLRSLRYQETKKLLEAGTPLFPVTPEQVYRRIYFGALDLIVSSIEERFDQPSFKAAYSNMESLLIGVLSSQDVSSQMNYMEKIMLTM